MQRSLPARKAVLQFAGLFLVLIFASCAYSQAALLLEQPYGFFGTLNPTGHGAIYLDHVCADTPVRVRACNPGETGVVISRYKGMASYDWMAIPLIPYLYAVEDPSTVPAQAIPETVAHLRDHYRETHLGELGQSLPRGNFFKAGWEQLIGTAYNRRIYAFRFATDQASDSKVIDFLNSRPNRSHFSLLFNNCADFDRLILSIYFPNTFGRNMFPDAGITTPKQVAHALLKYAKKYPEIQLTIIEIPQVPGCRHNSHAVHGIAEALITNGYLIPIVILNPYIAGGLVVDYLVRGRYRVEPKNPIVVSPEHLDALLNPMPQPGLQPQSLTYPTLQSSDGNGMPSPAESMMRHHIPVAPLVP